jgi:hypothetical protein
VSLTPLAKVLVNTPHLRERVLFGTDFYVVQAETTEREFSVRLRGALGEPDFWQIANRNPPVVSAACRVDGHPLTQTAREARRPARVIGCLGRPGECCIRVDVGVVACGPRRHLYHDAALPSEVGSPERTKRTVGDSASKWTRTGDEVVETEKRSLGSWAWRFPLIDRRTSLGMTSLPNCCLWN